MSDMEQVTHWEAALYRKNIVCFDLEIKKVIDLEGHLKNSPFSDVIQFAEGFEDWYNMGIASCATYSTEQDMWQVFTDENAGWCIGLLKNAHGVVTYNGKKFDENLLQAEWGLLPKERHYDIQHEIFLALGVADKEWCKEQHSGYSLNKMVKANLLNAEKFENGAVAPILYQTGQMGRLLNYNLSDTQLTWKLFKYIMRHGGLIDPKTGRFLKMRSPVEVLELLT